MLIIAAEPQGRVRDDSSICAEKVVLYPFQRKTLQMTTLLNPTDRRSDEFALTRRNGPMSCGGTSAFTRAVNY